MAIKKYFMHIDLHAFNLSNAHEKELLTYDRSEIHVAL